MNKFGWTPTKLPWYQRESFWENLATIVFIAILVSIMFV